MFVLSRGVECKLQDTSDTWFTRYGPVIFAKGTFVFAVFEEKPTQQPKPVSFFWGEPVKTGHLHTAARDPNVQTCCAMLRKPCAVSCNSAGRQAGMWATAAWGKWVLASICLNIYIYIYTYIYGIYFYFPLLDLKGIDHYWKYFSQGS